MLSAVPKQLSSQYHLETFAILLHLFLDIYWIILMLLYAGIYGILHWIQTTALRYRIRTFSLPPLSPPSTLSQSSPAKIELPLFLL